MGISWDTEIPNIVGISWDTEDNRDWLGLGFSYLYRGILICITPYSLFLIFLFFVSFGILWSVQLYGFYYQ